MVKAQIKNKNSFHGIGVSAFCGVMFGYNTGIIPYAANSFLLHKTQVLDNFSEKHWIILSSLVGACLGSFGAGFMAEVYGRRLCILTGVLLVCVGNSICMFSYFNYLIMIFGRIIVGFGVGVFSCMGPIYSAEMESKKQRGVFVAIFQTGITMSMLISSAGYYVEDRTFAWVTFFGIIYFIMALFTLYLLFCPESPRYLVGIHNSMASKNFSGVFETIEQVDDEIRFITEEKAKSKEISFFTALRKHKRMLLLGICMAFGQQMSGINTHFYFLKEVIQRGAQTKIIMVHSFNFLLSALTVLLVSKFPRKPQMLVGNGLVVLGLVIIGYSYLSDIKERMFIQICGMVFYFAGFQISLGPLFYIHISEMFPEVYRARFASIIISFNWLFNLVISYFFGFVAGKKIEGSTANYCYTYASFAVITFTTAAIYAQFMIETKGKTLREVQFAVGRDHKVKI